MESRLLEWLEMVKLEINNTNSNASGDERIQSISSLRRRIADACQRRETPAKVRSRSKKYAIPDRNPARSQIGAASVVTGQHRPCEWKLLSFKLIQQHSISCGSTIPFKFNILNDTWCIF